MTFIFNIISREASILDPSDPSISKEFKNVEKELQDKIKEAEKETSKIPDESTCNIELFFCFFQQQLSSF